MTPSSSRTWSTSSRRSTTESYSGARVQRRRQETRLLIVDMLTDPTHTQPVFAALAAGEFLVIAGEGDVYSEEELRAWLSETGWQPLEHTAAHRPDNPAGGRGQVTKWGRAPTRTPGATVSTSPSSTTSASCSIRCSCTEWRNSLAVGEERLFDERSAPRLIPTPATSTRMTCCRVARIHRLSRAGATVAAGKARSTRVATVAIAAPCASGCSGDGCLASDSCPRPTR